MFKRTLRCGALLIGLLALAVMTTLTTTTPRAIAAADFTADRYLVKAKKGVDLAALQATVERMGGKVVGKIPQINLLVVQGMGKLNRTQLAEDSAVAGVTRDTIKRLIRPEMQKELWGKAFSTEKKLEKIKVKAPAGVSKKDDIIPDPAFNLPNTMWTLYRTNGVKAWDNFGGTGVPQVVVGVADTGLDYTHIDLADNVVEVVDFTYLEEPYNICRDFVGGFTDQDLADLFGGPANGDWNGHGSWIGGNIGGVLNETGVNGAAPHIALVALKISQWCGSAFDSEILAAITFAGDYSIDVVNISFGGYTDRSTPEGELGWQQYREAVKYANAKGTMIVSSAGNDHVRLGKHGKVVSHGPLTAPGTDPADFNDLFGLYETPAGIPGVVAVSALGNVVAETSPSCPTGTFETSNATCKPDTDAHQPIGQRRENQLAYYSNYGKRINLSAPGGARKFNLPVWDRGGTPGFPYTDADGTFVFEAFSTTSNWAIEIPCFDLSSISGFTDDCYTSIQGTSMSSPAVVGAAAQVLSARPDIRKAPKQLLQFLQATATQLDNNRTPPLSATDTSAGDLTGLPCDTGYCHLGGDRIPSREAYGRGLVNADAAINH